jgi:hypothetical protein
MSKGKRPLFSDHGMYNADAVRLENQIRKVVNPLILQWIEDGFLPQDIELVTVYAVHGFSAEARLVESMKIKRSKKLV